MRFWLIIPFIAFWIGINVFQSVWGSLLCYHALLLPPLIIHRDRWHVGRIFKGFSWLWLFVHLVGCAVVFWGLTEYAAAKEFELNLERFGAAGMGFVLYFVLVNPIFEEVFWRDLMARPGKWPILEDVAFGAFHSVILIQSLEPIYVLGFVILLAFMGWLWRQLRFKLDGLAVPWLGHLCGDLMFAAIVALLIR